MLALDSGIGLLGLDIAPPALPTASGLVRFIGAVAEEKEGSHKRNAIAEREKRKMKEEVMGDVLVKTEEEVRLQLQMTSSMIEVRNFLCGTNDLEEDSHASRFAPFQLISSLPNSLPDPPTRLVLKSNNRIPGKR